MKDRKTVLRLLFHKKIFSLGVLLLFVLPSLKMEVQANQEFKSKYNDIIEPIALKYNVDPKLIHSIIRAESNYNSIAVSPKGAVGLMQLMPETAKEFGVENLYDPKENIEGGVKYLDYLCKLYNNRKDLVLAAYNAGQEAIKKYGGIPPYPETINYIKKVNGSHKKSTIRRKTIIYKFYDKSGRLIFTNDRTYYLLNKRKQNTNSN